MLIDVVNGNNFTLRYDTVDRVFRAYDGSDNELSVELSDDPFLMGLFIYFPLAIDLRDVNNYLDSLDSALTDSTETVLSSISTSSDNLTNVVNSSINTLNSSLASFADTLTNEVNTSANDVKSLFDSKANYIIDDLTQKLSSIHCDSSSFVLSSLNGSYGSYKDGSTVSVNGLTDKFKVEASFFMLNDQNQFIIVYKLSDLSNPDRIVFVPNLFVTLLTE